MKDAVLCSDCFENTGLRLDAHQLGHVNGETCPACSRTNGAKLSADDVAELAHRFFVLGTTHKSLFGSAPQIQLSNDRAIDVTFDKHLEMDAKLISEKTGLGLFPYGPRLWMLGEITPLIDLQDSNKQNQVFRRIIDEYPSTNLCTNQPFFRIRKNPASPANPLEYDSPPDSRRQYGRLDSEQNPILYASSDLQTCLHECRIATEDETYVATLQPNSELKLLDLTHLLAEERVSEFESLDLAVHFLFLAGAHSYPITRNLAEAVRNAGFAGIAFPSYFSFLRTGAPPFETYIGISSRRFSSLSKRETAKIVPNIALFGRPIQQQTISLSCINRIFLEQTEISVRFGPVLKE